MDRINNNSSYEKETKLRKDKSKGSNVGGITLIALIITIIVMLILVTVTISLAVNGGLFGYAGKATRGTKNVQLQENELSKGRVKIDGIWYDSIEDYMNERPSANQEDEPINEEGEGGTLSLPEGWIPMTTAPIDWDTTKVIAITDGTNNVPLPKGYNISEIASEQTVDGGLVIKDSNNNEFVWIPVPDGVKVATYDDRYVGYNVYGDPSYEEPAEMDGSLEYVIDYLEPRPGPEEEERLRNATFDSQEFLDYLYEPGFLNYETKFDYEAEYVAMTTSVNKYKGFFIGRYETTIDSDLNIGSVVNTPLLTSNLKTESEGYSYRWYGMYHAQKATSYIGGNGEVVQSAMMYGQLYEKLLDFFDTEGADYSATKLQTRTSSRDVENSAQSNYSYNSETIKDVILNIYDLRGNGLEWTQGGNYSDWGRDGRLYFGYFCHNRYR